MLYEIEDETLAELSRAEPKIPGISSLTSVSQLIGYKIKYKKNGVFYLLKPMGVEHDINRLCVWKDYVSDRYQLRDINTYTFLQKNLYLILKKD